MHTRIIRVALGRPRWEQVRWLRAEFRTGPKIKTAAATELSFIEHEVPDAGPTIYTASHLLLAVTL